MDNTSKKLDLVNYINKQNAQDKKFPRSISKVKKTSIVSDLLNNLSMRDKGVWKSKSAGYAPSVADET